MATAVKDDLLRLLEDDLLDMRTSIWLNLVIMKYSHFVKQMFCPNLKHHGAGHHICGGLCCANSSCFPFSILKIELIVFYPILCYEMSLTVFDTSN